MGLNHGYVALVGCHVHDTADNDRVTVNIHQALYFGTPLRDGNTDFPDGKTLFRTQTDQLAIGKPGDDQSVLNGRCTGTAQCQYRYRAIMYPELFTTVNVQCRDIAIDGLDNHLVKIDLWNREHLTADIGLPQQGPVIGTQGQHFGITGTHENQATARARPGGDGYLGFYLPVFLAGFCIQGHHSTLAIGNEHLVVIDDRHQIDKLLVVTDTDTGLPELFQGHGISNLNQFRGWLGIIRPPEKTAGPFRQGGTTAQQCRQHHGCQRLLHSDSSTGVVEATTVLSYFSCSR